MFGTTGFVRLSLAVVFAVTCCWVSSDKALAEVTRPTDDNLRATFIKERKTFEQLRDMMLSDAKLTCVGQASINEFAVKDNQFSELLNKAGIDEKRYEEYLSLLMSVNCTNVAYTTSANGNGSKYDNKNELWFLAWNSTNRQSKNIVFTVDGSLPYFSLIVPDTDVAMEDDVDRTRFAATRLGPHWFIVQAKWVSPVVSNEFANLEALLNIIANAGEILCMSIAMPAFATSLTLLYLPDRRKLGIVMLPVSVIIWVIGLALPGFISGLVSAIRG